MASELCTKNATLPQGEDLRQQYAGALKLNASGQVVPCNAAGDMCIGFLASVPPTADAGFGVSVALVGGGGIGKARASGAITRGHLIVPSTTAGEVSGAANIGALAANQMAVGVALEAASAANEIIEVLLMPIAGS